MSYAVRLERASGPLYRQAAAHLRAAVSDGRLRLGASLPTEAELATGFGVSLITIRHALRELESEGVLGKRAGRPAVVMAGMPRTARVLNTLEDVIAAAADARLEIFDYAVRTNEIARRALRLAPDTPTHRLHARLLSGGRAISEISIHLPPHIGRRLRRADFDDVVVFRTVQRRLGIQLSGAQVTVGAELADPPLADLLGVAPGAAVLRNTTLYRDVAGEGMEYTVARHRADLYEFSYELRA